MTRIDLYIKFVVSDIRCNCLYPSKYCCPIIVSAIILLSERFSASLGNKFIFNMDTAPSPLQYKIELELPIYC
jgi:hypothetical protein